MCGRYALGIRASFVRHQFEAHNMPVADAPEDDDVRQTYNFAPGNHGLVYRAIVPDFDPGQRHQEGAGDEVEIEGRGSPDVEDPKETQYKLQAMKWGLIPFWTKRNPDYGSVMKTINARDDSLASSGGMWHTMKQKKRCIVVAQGFYEWLKKNGGKEKIPHFTKRTDGQLMCFAGLWDCVQYEGSENKIYTYTIITTDSNKQLSFLHDRMPVILENGSDQIRTWLDPGRLEWSKELQSLLKPFNGQLECYPVDQAVGKVGNNSPTYIVPVASSQNKNNIANFFGNTKKATKGREEKEEVQGRKLERDEKGVKAEHESDDFRETVDQSSTEDNAPLPVPPSTTPKSGSKRGHEDVSTPSDESPKHKYSKKNEDVKDPSIGHISTGIPDMASAGKLRSATSNGSKRSPVKAGDGSHRITHFFNK